MARILLAEDRPDVRKFMTFLVEGQGHTVVSAEDGVKALKIYKEEGPFDLLLTDNDMPQQHDGVALIKNVRAINPNQRVMFMSGMLDPEDVYKLLPDFPKWQAEGTADFLGKPFKNVDMLAAINKLLDTAPRTELPQSPPTPPVSGASAAEGVIP